MLTLNEAAERLGKENDMDTTTKYRVILYHDEPDEAAADTRTDALADTFDAAVKAARKAFNGYWTSGTIDRGQLHPERFGESPEWFEDDERSPVAYVGPDWIDR